MSARLQEYIKPLSLCDRGDHLRGAISLAGMGRLAGLLCHQNGEVKVDLEFGVDAQSIKFLRGQLKSLVALQCQRCMAAIETPVEIDISLGFVSSEEAGKRLPDEYDPFVMESPTVILLELVEDELILALPIVTFHPEDECEVMILKPQPEDDIPLATKEKKPNPFTALAGLKKAKSDEK